MEMRWLDPFLASLAVCVVGIFSLGEPAGAAVVREDFSNPPSGHGWRVAGDPSHFAWDAGAGRVGVTWDSSRPNAFFLRPLGTILTRAEDFRFAATLVLDEIQTASPDATFQLALGLLRESDTRATNFFRGAGVNPAWGPRNLIEFDYFPASRAITPTFSAVAVATNNLRWATANLFPFELTTGNRYRLALAYTAADRTLRLTVERDGEPWCDGSVRLDDRFGDFRVDAFSVTSYSGDHQPAGYGGQLVARGWLDDLEIEYPDPPAPRLAIVSDPTAPGLRITSGVLAGWTPHLDRTRDWVNWDELPAPTVEEGVWVFLDADSNRRAAAYQLRLDRP